MLLTVVEFQHPSTSDLGCKGWRRGRGRGEREEKTWNGRYAKMVTSGGKGLHLNNSFDRGTFSQLHRVYIYISELHIMKTSDRSKITNWYFPEPPPPPPLKVVRCPHFSSPPPFLTCGVLHSEPEVSQMDVVHTEEIMIHHELKDKRDVRFMRLKMVVHDCPGNKEIS